jgi:hypothetical protein
MVLDFDGFLAWHKHRKMDMWFELAMPAWVSTAVMHNLYLFPPKDHITIALYLHKEQYRLVKSNQIAICFYW